MRLSFFLKRLGQYHKLARANLIKSWWSNSMLSLCLPQGGVGPTFPESQSFVLEHPAMELRCQDWAFFPKNVFSQDIRFLQTEKSMPVLWRHYELTRTATASFDPEKSHRCKGPSCPETWQSFSANWNWSMVRIK